MVIRKEYDIKEMQECLDTLIAKAVENDSYSVKIPFILAQEIYDVLEETLRKEQKNQTLESALTFIEKENGTQTNEMEYNKDEKEELSEFEKYHGYKKPDCYSMITGDYEVCERCSYSKTCAFRVKQKEMSPRRINNLVTQSETEEPETKEENLPNCFASYFEENIDCGFCDLLDRCRKATPKEDKQRIERLPICFGYFYTDCKQCDNNECIHRMKCMENSRNE